MPPHALLIGLRGSGKSTLGRAAAHRLGLPFTDLDDLTPARLGSATPAEALRLHGEPAFRHAEAQALQDAIDRHMGLLALGGGTPTAPGATRAIAESNARVIYLRASPATLRARLKDSNLASRPALTPTGTLDEIDDLFARRDPLYRSIAHVVIDVDGQSQDQSLERLLAALARPLSP